MDIHKASVVLDTETVSLEAGSGVHQVGLWDMSTKTGYQWYTKPHYVEIIGRSTQQDYVNLSANASEAFKYVSKDFWADVITARVKMKYGALPPGSLQEFLEQNEPYLAKALQDIPWLADKPLDPIQIEKTRQMLSAVGGTLGFTKTDVDIRDLVREDSDLSKLMQGKITWIANAGFESKQFGAVIGAVELENPQQYTIREVLAHQSPNNPNLLYTTGLDLADAKLKAQMTGDWSGVWKHYSNLKPTPGQITIADPLDLVRSFYSYGYNLGLTKERNPLAGTSVDVVAQLLNPNIGEETHLALTDAAKHEAFIIEEMYDLLPAMQHVAQGTETGRKYVRQARQGQGPLARASRVLKRREQMLAQIERKNLVEQISRSAHDIETDGKVWVTDTKRVHFVTQVTPTGETFEQPVVLHNKRALDTVDEVVEHLRPRYKNIDVDAVLGEFKALRSRGEVKAWAWANRTLDFSAATAEADMSGFVGFPKGKLPLPKGINFRNIGMLGGAVMGGVAMGALLYGAYKATHREPRPMPKSVVTYSYQDWLKQQADYFSLDQTTSGMRESGIAGQNRSANTDFGSPYQGPRTSNYVLLQQDMLRERERKLREAYGARHSDINLFAEFNLKGTIHYFLSQGRDVQDYKGTFGKNKALDLSKYRVTAEDADTLVLRRRGLLGYLTPKYSFRLAGIDSTEVVHGTFDRGTGQPYGEQAKTALQKMIDKGSKLELIFDPKQASYGRMLGAIVVDGKNLNYEMVKRGIAAHLPYEKAENALVDYAQMARAEKRAYEANRGMWAEPWARAFYEVQANQKQKLTFNSLNSPGRVAESGSMMSILSFMQQVQESGKYTLNDQRLAKLLAKDFRPISNDIQTPGRFNQPNSSFARYQDTLKQDIVRFMHQSDSSGFNTVDRGDYYEPSQVVDTQRTTMGAWNKRPYYAFQQYRMRKSRMAAMQRHALQQMRQSPIGHNRM